MCVNAAQNSWGSIKRAHHIAYIMLRFGSKMYPIQRQFGFYCLHWEFCPGEQRLIHSDIHSKKLDFYTHSRTYLANCMYCNSAYMMLSFCFGGYAKVLTLLVQVFRWPKKIPTSNSMFQAFKGFIKCQNKKIFLISPRAFWENPLFVLWLTFNHGFGGPWAIFFKSFIIDTFISNASKECFWPKKI